MIVKFIEVGRNKMSWEATCKSELTYEWLYDQVRKALISSNIDFTDNGTIWAGFRPVGKFEVVEEASKS